MYKSTKKIINKKRKIKYTSCISYQNTIICISDYESRKYKSTEMQKQIHSSLHLTGTKNIFLFFCYFLLLIISAAITPGTQPQSVSKNTIINDPQPLSTMAKGGKIIQRITRQMDITIDF